MPGPAAPLEAHLGKGPIRPYGDSRAGFKLIDTGEYDISSPANPGHARAHNNLGNALGRSGRLEEAVEQYEKALAIDPRHSRAHNNLAMTLESLGRLDQAISHYRRAVEIDPGYAKARARLDQATRLQSGRN